jgi:hypothetical protein
MAHRPTLRRQHFFRMHQVVDRAFSPRFFGSATTEFALSSGGLVAVAWTNEENNKALVSVVDPSGPRLLSNHRIYVGTDARLAASGTRMAWFADGQRLLISTNRNKRLLYVVRAGRGTGFDTHTVKDLPTRAVSIDSLEVSPDDRRVAMSVSVRYDGTDRVHKEVFVLNLGAGTVTQVTSIPEAARAGRVSAFATTIPCGHPMAGVFCSRPTRACAASRPRPRI